MNLQNKDLLRSTTFINGKWIAADSAKTLSVTDPASGQVIAEVPCCGEAETRRAIDAANAAWPVWKALTAKRRAQLLQAWNKLILENADDLARLITAEGGKPLLEAKGEVLYGASFVEWFAEEGKRTYGESIPSPAASTRLLVVKQPIGVCAAITPWNFPLAMITRKVAPALAAGCPVVVKPAESTPLTALALAALAEQAGFPAGVFNVVTGNPAEIGGELCANPIVRKLSFTGSTAVGRLLMRSAPQRSKNSHSNSAATRHSLCLMMPMSMLRSTRRWRPNIATPVKPASALTVFLCKPAFTNNLPASWPKKLPSLKLVGGAMRV